MEQADTEAFDMKKMIADYMENGLLDNIIDMFKRDDSLYAYVGDLLTDERMRVRIGITALIEALKKEAPDKVTKALPSVSPLLKDSNPVVRGDAAYLLGIIGDKGVIPMLAEIAGDKDPNVRVIAEEAIEEIKSNSGPG